MHSRPHFLLPIFLGLGLSLLATTITQAEPAVATIAPYLQNVSPSGIVVIWDTDNSSDSLVEYGRSQAYGQQVSDTTAVTHHEVRLTGLQPETHYYYRVKSGGNELGNSEFVTATERTVPFTFAVIGDTRTNDTVHQSVIKSMMADDPLFYLSTGDLVSDGQAESNWLNFFRIEQPLMQQAPFYGVIGNHDISGSTSVTLYRKHFVLPENSPSPERYYSFNYSNVHFTIIDFLQSYQSGTAQYKWIESDLAEASQNPQIEHLFVFIHHGPYDSGSGHGSNTTARTYLVPLFERYNVEIVFSGHNHDYERGKVNGISYIVIGGGGAPLYDVGTSSWTIYSESTYHHCTLLIDGGKVEYAAVKPNGSVFDSMSYERVPVAMPVADAGADIDAQPGQAVSLDGSKSSDPNNQSLIYQWSQISGPTVDLINPTTAKPHFTPDQTGDYIFALIVSNSQKKSLPDQVTVHVQNGRLCSALPRAMTHSHNQLGLMLLLFTTMLLARRQKVLK
jgi:predicted phosphodiesterase